MFSHITRRLKNSAVSMSESMPHFLNARGLSMPLVLTVRARQLRFANWPMRGCRLMPQLRLREDSERFTEQKTAEFASTHDLWVERRGRLLQGNAWRRANRDRADYVRLLPATRASGGPGDRRGGGAAAARAWLRARAYVSH